MLNCIQLGFTFKDEVIRLNGSSLCCGGDKLAQIQASAYGFFGLNFGGIYSNCWESADKTASTQTRVGGPLTFPLVPVGWVTFVPSHSPGMIAVIYSAV